ncbi:MAG TPA: helix-turn-helix domain-containing protein [Noviherbaspirillum sp.]|jgi:DNA-binding IclR family transcriptional regulator|uniref:IclR family transcriptional regulator n=1 Tax=Noviherbaspirillum sp. TaxID=1926288 RepID=UPI002DDD1755|nr:helix-turn-helix domain-containing protein [Noviherbaspirillum sp.]HEV2611913.1 helix-turn-helix domain-containing protein [Noviherbaspirillum sp.]
MEKNLVKSAARAIQVLEFFDTVRRASPVAEVADHFGWPHSSTSALMRSLVSLGYLHFDAGARTYIPSMRVALLGDWLHGPMLSHGKLSQLLEQLNHATGETVVLAAQNGLHSQYLRVLQGTNTLRMHLQIGTLRPLLSSGTGRMLLTQMDDGTIRKLTRKFNLASDAAHPVNAEELLRQVAEDRERGYAVSMNQVTPHATLIAMLLPTRPTEKPLAIGIAGLTDRLIANERKYVRTMQEAINALFE